MADIPVLLAWAADKLKDWDPERSHRGQDQGSWLAPAYEGLTPGGRVPLSTTLRARHGLAALCNGMLPDDKDSRDGVGPGRGMTGSVGGRGLQGVTLAELCIWRDPGPDQPHWLRLSRAWRPRVP